jgi:hypothetical protein
MVSLAVTRSDQRQIFRGWAASSRSRACGRSASTSPIASTAGPRPSPPWSRLIDYPDGPMFELGPVLDAQHQLLTDDQCLRLLCEGVHRLTGSVRKISRITSCLAPHARNWSAAARAGEAEPPLPARPHPLLDGPSHRRRGHQRELGLGDTWPTFAYPEGITPPSGFRSPQPAAGSAQEAGPAGPGPTPGPADRLGRGRLFLRRGPRRRGRARAVLPAQQQHRRPALGAVSTPPPPSILSVVPSGRPGGAGGGRTGRFFAPHTRTGSRRRRAGLRAPGPPKRAETRVRAAGRDPGPPRGRLPITHACFARASVSRRVSPYAPRGTALPAVPSAQCSSVRSALPACQID